VTRAVKKARVDKPALNPYILDRNSTLT
jgi:hypothetical protein